jgi:hypothetical protein
MDLPGGLVLPVSSLLERPVEGDSPGTGTVINTAAAIPALIRVQYDRWFAFYWIGYEHVYLADFYTNVAPIADIGIKNHRSIRCNHIGHGNYFFLSHLFLPNWLGLIRDFYFLLYTPV